MSANFASELILRQATLDDARLLHAWRNDSFTREVSRDVAAVPWPDHQGWLVRVLASSDRIIRIAEQNGDPVGVVRADRVESGWELSWSVAPEARGRGIGGRMLKQFMASLDGQVLAVIRRNNLASQKIAAAAGLTHVGPVGEAEFDLWKRE